MKKSSALIKANCERRGVPFGYRQKLVKCGSHLTLFSYSDLMFTSYKSKKQNYEKAEEGVKSQKNLQRTRNDLKWTIDSNSNFYSKFITLTYKSAELDRDKVIEDFHKFLAKFKRKFGYGLKYVGVLEHQKKRGKKEGNEGSWHIHLIVFNGQHFDLDLFNACWGLGGTDLHKVDTTENLGLYLMKYITKEQVEFGKKAILKSQGLKQPEVYYDLDIPYCFSDTTRETYSFDYSIDVDSNGKTFHRDVEVQEFESLAVKEQQRDK